MEEQCRGGWDFPIPAYSPSLQRNQGRNLNYLLIPQTQPREERYEPCTPTHTQFPCYIFIVQDPLPRKWYYPQWARECPFQVVQLVWASQTAGLIPTSSRQPSYCEPFPGSSIFLRLTLRELYYLGDAW